MCAICLGLAGNTHLTGRTGQLSDFVKYGCEQAVIEIELENPSKSNAVVTRIIERDSSTWLLDKKLVSFDEIQEIVRNFNIDVSNLCQFLPQEKVKEFAMMDKKARLKNMLQCIGDPYLFTTYQELKQLKMKSSKLDEEIGLCQRHIKEENDKIERLKIEADKHELQLRSIEHLKSFEQLKLYLDYGKTREHFDEIKLKKKSLRKISEKLNEEIPLMKDKINVKRLQLRDTLEQLREKNRKLVNIQKDVLEKQQEMAELQDMVSNAKVLYGSKIVEKRNQLTKLTQLCQEKEELNSFYDSSKVEGPHLEDQNKDLSKRLEEIKNEISSLTSDRGYIVLKLKQLEESNKKKVAEIELAEKEETKKMDFLKENFENVYKAVSWLKDNKSKFNGTVYGPMLLVLRLEKNHYCKLIENCINEEDLIAFFCEDKEDFKLLIRTLKVNIVLTPEKSIEEYESPTLSDEFREMGVEGFVKDYIKVPDPIMCFLCECYKLHLMPVCSSYTDDNVELLLQNFHSVVTPDMKFVRKQSKYGDQNMNTIIDSIRESDILRSSGNYSVNLESLIEDNQENQEMTDVFLPKLKELEAKIEEQEREENMLREMKKNIQTKLKEFSTYERRLNQKIISYENKKKELIDEVSEKNIVIKKVQEMCNSVLQNEQIIHHITASLMDFSATMEQKLKCYLKARLTEKKLVVMQKLLEEKEKEQKEVEKDLEEVKENSNQMMQKGYYLMVELIKLVPKENSTEDPDFDVNSNASIRQKFEQIIPALKEMFKPYLINNVLDLQREIYKIQTQLDNSEDTTAAFNEFNERTQQVLGIEKKVEAFQMQVKEIEKDMARKKENWLPDLQKHITNVNNKFSRYYAELGCAGEVCLDTCNNSDDFLNYGLQINVKYRDSEPFAELSKAHHSGGECSVAAIIFILSLQDLMQIPFRCIDEINQGMDDVNERIIYDLIALNIKNEFCPQYFLLTPKLLQDLEIMEYKDIKVHIIFNSSFLEMDLDVRKHIDRLKYLSDNESNDYMSSEN
ncbi:structural maintenance of chromosomes protein 5 isoform X2 [Parasteatoda tepidariorum]